MIKEMREKFSLNHEEMNKTSRLVRMFRSWQPSEYNAAEIAVMKGHASVIPQLKDCIDFSRHIVYEESHIIAAPTSGAIL